MKQINTKLFALCRATGRFALLLVGSLVVFQVIGGYRAFAAQQEVVVELFRARNAFGTGDVRSIEESRAFSITRETVTFAGQDTQTAVISSTRDGRGQIVIDNFLTIDGENACVGERRTSCFGPIFDGFKFLQVLEEGQVNIPIEQILTPVPPIDVSSFIGQGTTEVTFTLDDHGGIAGNTDLFLVIRPKPQCSRSRCAMDAAATQTEDNKRCQDRFEACEAIFGGGSCGGELTVCFQSAENTKNMRVDLLCQVCPLE